MIDKPNKHQLILRDIAAQHLPEYQGREAELMATYRHYNVEHIVEDAMCRVGGYEFVDAHHYDNSDFSDTKTASIGYGGVACVNGILSKKGRVPKGGDLRVVLYNPVFDRLDYYFIPKAGWESIREYGDANGDKLRAQYNWEFDRIHRWEQWRVKDFETLAKMPATVTEPHEFTPIARNRFDDLFALEMDIDTGKIASEWQRLFGNLGD